MLHEVFQLQPATESHTVQGTVLGIKHGSFQICLQLLLLFEMKTESMVQDKTSAVMVCRSSGGMLSSAR